MNSLAESYFLHKINFKSTDVVIDVGANIDEVSLWLVIKNIDKVFSFEPDQIENKVLKLNCSKYSNIEIFNEAVY